MTRTTLLLILSVLLSACSMNDTAPPRAPDEIRLYVFDCGSLTFEDVAAFGLSNEETPVRELFVPCYLIDHPAGQLFWDGGLPPAIAGKGDVEAGPGTTMRYDRSVLDQLADIEFTPADIEFAAFSHMHFDHVGAANAFTDSHLLIQQTEYDAAFLHGEDNPVFNPADYAALRNATKTLLNGDHDVFGDGRVVIISAPGHTPGHQVLSLDLKQTGPIILSGDLYHFRESIALRRTPEFNTNRADTLNSMMRVSALLAEKRAVLWLEHEKAFADTLNFAPAYYR